MFDICLFTFHFLMSFSCLLFFQRSSLCVYNFLQRKCCREKVVYYYNYCKIETFKQKHSHWVDYTRKSIEVLSVCVGGGLINYCFSYHHPQASSADTPCPSYILSRCLLTSPHPVSGSLHANENCSSPWRGDRGVGSVLLPLQEPPVTKVTQTEQTHTPHDVQLWPLAVAF